MQYNNRFYVCYTIFYVTLQPEQKDTYYEESSHTPQYSPL